MLLGRRGLASHRQAVGPWRMSPINQMGSHGSTWGTAGPGSWGSEVMCPLGGPGEARRPGQPQMAAAWEQKEKWGTCPYEAPGGLLRNNHTAFPWRPEPSRWRRHGAPVEVTGAVRVQGPDSLTRGARGTVLHLSVFLSPGKLGDRGPRVAGLS